MLLDPNNRFSFPNETQISFTIAPNQYTSANFTGAKFVSTLDTLVLASVTSLTVAPLGVTATPSEAIAGSSMIVNWGYTACSTKESVGFLKTANQYFVFKSGSVTVDTTLSTSITGDFLNGFATFYKSGLTLTTNYKLKIGAFETTLTSNNINTGAAYTKNHYIYTSTSKIPANVRMQLSNTTVALDGVRLDDYNFIFEATITTTDFNITVSNASELFRVPLSISVQNVRQIYINYEFDQTAMFLLKFPLAAVGKTSSTCTNSSLKVTINNTVIFN